jgi:hypothetical protein
MQVDDVKRVIADFRLVMFATKNNLLINGGRNGANCTTVDCGFGELRRGVKRRGKIAERLSAFRLKRLSERLSNILFSTNKLTR